MSFAEGAEDIGLASGVELWRLATRLDTMEPIRLDSITETRMSLGVNDQRMKNVNAHQAAIKPHLESCLYNKLNTFQLVADCLNSKDLRIARGSERYA